MGRDIRTYDQICKRCLKKAIGKNCLSYDELHTLVVEIEAVLNSRPLTCVSSEDVDEPLTPSHLLVRYRIMTLPDPSIPEDPEYSSEAFTHPMNHLVKTLGPFWKWWKREYLLKLREFHRTQGKGGISHKLGKGEVVTVYDEGHPRGLWRLGIIEDLITSSDGYVCGVFVKVMSKKGHPKTLRRPIQHIYPLEVHSACSESSNASPDPNQGLTKGVKTVPEGAQEGRPVRRAAVKEIGLLDA